jgi:hypothetical protein
MSKFMVRVILHDAETSASYDGLNAAMVQLGFSRELQGKKASYHLPTGDYWHQGDMSASDLRVMAATAAEGTGQDFGLIVVRVDGWSVMRLKKVEAAPQA